MDPKLRVTGDSTAIVLACGVLADSFWKATRDFWITAAGLTKGARAGEINRIEVLAHLHDACDAEWRRLHPNDPVPAHRESLSEYFKRAVRPRLEETAARVPEPDLASADQLPSLLRPQA